MVRSFVIALLILMPALGALRCKDPSQDECYRISYGAPASIGPAHRALSDGEVEKLKAAGWKVTEAKDDKCEGDD
jgi:hypothetical protein